MQIKKLTLSLLITMSACSPLMAAFNDTQALQAGLYFFNENALGPINENIKIPANTGVPYHNPVAWRGDSFVQDGRTIINGQLVTIPGLNTGFADAGDTIKYNLPQAYAMMILAWSGVEYKQAYVNSGEYSELANVLRWGMEYLLNCWQPDTTPGANPATSNKSFLVVQTGIGAQAEHNLWIPDEVFEQALKDNQSSLPSMPLGNGQSIPYQRLAYYVNLAHPGPDIGGAMASAMAAGATFFANSPIASDRVLATQLYTAAQQVLLFSQNMAKSSNTGLLIANKNMGYSGLNQTWQGDMAQTDSTTTYNDQPGIPSLYAGKLALASLWLAQASNAIDNGAHYQSYLTQGETILANAKLTAQDSSWTLDWGNFYYGAFLLLAKMDPNGTDPVSQSVPKFTYAQDVQSWVANLQHNASLNPDDFGYLAGWESLRYATDSSFVAALADQYLKTNQFQQFAYDQLDYVEGHNPAGYNYEIGVVGSGSQNALNAHNATAQDSWSQSQDLNDNNGHSLYAHQMIGAMVGGPASADGMGYNPTVNDYGTNEPTLDGNASFVGALAAQYQAQAPFSPSVFPPKKPSTLAWPEFYGTVNISPNQNGEAVNLTEFNHSAWPARMIYNETATLYFNFSDMPAGKSINDVKVTYNYAPGYASPIWTKLDNSGHYSLSLSTQSMTYPGGTWANGLGAPPDHRQAQIILNIPWNHNFNQDWSFQGLQPDPYDPTSQNYGQFAPNIAIYGAKSPTGNMELLGGAPFNDTSGSAALSFSNLPSTLPSGTSDSVSVDNQNFVTCPVSATPSKVGPLTPGQHTITVADITVQNGSETDLYHFAPQVITIEAKQALPVMMPFPAPSIIHSYTTAVTYTLKGLANAAANPGASVTFTDPQGGAQKCMLAAGQVNGTCTIINREQSGQSETFTVTAPSIPSYNLTSNDKSVIFTAGIASPNQLSATYQALATYPVYVAGTIGHSTSARTSGVVDFKAASNGQVYPDNVPLDGAQHAFNLPKDSYTITGENITVNGKTFAASSNPNTVIINGNTAPQIALDYEPLGSCVISYHALSNYWPVNGGQNGATLNVNIINQSGQTIPANWTLTLSGNNLVGQSGVWNWQNVSISNGTATGTAGASWETIAPGQTLSGVGMNLLLSAPHFNLESATLNGQPCELQSL